MKLLFRRKRDGYIMKPIQTMAKYVRLRHVHSGLECMTTKANLPEGYDVLTHDIERGDVLRDIRDGVLLVVQRVTTSGVVLQCGAIRRRVLLVGLVNYTRVGRNYAPKQFKRPGVVAKEITRTEHPYTKYDERKVREHIDNARAQAAAMIQAGNDAKRFGIGVLLVYPDGSMKSTDPRSVIMK